MFEGKEDMKSGQTQEPHRNKRKTYFRNED